MGNEVPDTRPLAWVLVRFVPTSHFPLLRARSVFPILVTSSSTARNRLAYKLTFLSDEVARMSESLLHQNGS